MKKKKCMKKQPLIAVLTLTCFLGLGVCARAEDKPEVVNVPFEFVAGGKILSGAHTACVVRLLQTIHV